MKTKLILILILLVSSINLLLGQVGEDNCKESFWECFDFDLWKRDSNACEGYRIMLYVDIMSNKECLFSLDTLSLYDLYNFFGFPNFKTDRNKKYINVCYWIECGPNIGKNNTNTDLQDLRFRDIRYIEFLYDKTRGKITNIYAGIP